MYPWKGTLRGTHPRIKGDGAMQRKKRRTMKIMGITDKDGMLGIRHRLRDCHCVHFKVKCFDYFLFLIFPNKHIN